MSVRRRLLCILAGLGLLLAGGCGRPGLGDATTVVGGSGREVSVLVDEHVTSALAATFTPFLDSRPVRVAWAAGPADNLAETVKAGYRFDVVVLPSGPALDRVRDELAGRPVSIGALDGTRYWAAPITARGVPFVAFVAGRSGARVLRAHGLR
ncbi:MAG: hypothetical protein ACXV3A_11260 [Kineosporiaceae bacterium]